MIAASSANQPTAADITPDGTRWAKRWTRAPASDPDQARLLAWTVALGSLPALLLGVVIAWLMSPATVPVVTDGTVPVVRTPAVPTPAVPTPVAPVPVAPVPVAPVPVAPVPVAPARIVPAAAPTGEAAEPAPGELRTAAPPASGSESASPVVPAALDVATAGAATDQGVLGRDEVKEVQGRLRAFGFYPGPIDGVAGPKTQSAVQRYQQARGQPQQGAIDRDLLQQLRQDPAATAVQRQTNRAASRADGHASAANAPSPRRSDPFDRIGHWFRSLFH